VTRNDSTSDQDHSSGEPAEAGPYDAKIATLRQADAGASFDWPLRYLVVAAAGIALYYATGDRVMLIWLAAYLTANAFYAVSLYRLRGSASRKRYRLFVLGNFVSSGIFVFMPLYLWTMEGQPALHAMAIAGIAGHAVFNLSRHKTRCPVAYWDMFCIVLYCFFLGITEILRSPTLAEDIVLFVGMIAVSGYYILAQMGNITTQERLAEAQVAAVHDQKIRAIGRLTGGVAHDFNNILTVVKGNLELYQELRTPEEREEVINEALAAATRAEGVIAQLLAFSRQSRLAPTLTNIEPLTLELASMSKRLLPSTLTATFEIEPDLKPVVTDSNQLCAAVMNLILNARDAMSGKTGAIEVAVKLVTGPVETLSGRLPASSYLRFTVSDQGDGMTPDTLARITEPFFTTKDTGDGSGLGLSMARGFAEQSGGGVHIDSALGVGTTVSLYIDARLHSEHMRALPPKSLAAKSDAALP
jgi:signal transduction histidine kinase